MAQLRTNDSSSGSQPMISAEVKRYLGTIGRKGGLAGKPEDKARAARTAWAGTRKPGRKKRLPAPAQQAAAGHAEPENEAALASVMADLQAD